MVAGSSRTRFRKSQRLLSRGDFDRVQNGREVRRASSAHFLILLSDREAAQTGARLGIIASRRVGSSVRRNRAKRLIREFFRSATGLGDYDMVVVVKTGAEKLSAAKAAAELSATVARARKAAPSSDPRPPRAKKSSAKGAVKTAVKAKRPRS